MWDSDEHLNEFDRFLLETNLVGATSLDELHHRERMFANLRSLEWQQKQHKKDFSYKHLKAIHKYIFQDVYSWAGKDRYEMGLYGFMAKGDSIFCKGGFLPEQSKSIFGNLKAQKFYKGIKDKDKFAQNLASFVADLNALHPFREGNGRVQRIFINELAQNAGFTLDINLTPKEQMLSASIQSVNGDTKGLCEIIRRELNREELQNKLDRNLRNYEKVSDEKQKQAFLDKANNLVKEAESYCINLDSKSVQKLERANKENDRGMER